MICILWPSRGTYATFIHAHVKHLPAKTQLLYGGTIPRFYGDHERLEPHNLLYRVYRKIAVSLFKVPSETFEKKGLTRFLTKNKVAVVLAESGPIGVAVLPSVRTAKIPFFVYFHGNDAYCYPEMARDSYPELFRHAHGIFVVSREMEQQLLKLGASRHKLYYNPSGVDISLFQSADPSKAPPVFLSVGRFVNKKGPQFTLLAFNRVAEAVPEARLMMIGEGPLWESCKLLVRALKLTESVEFLGKQTHEQVAEIMRGVRGLVQHSIQTSYGEREGTPNVILEAGASGLPVVATRHAGIADAVLDGETGLLVEEGDIEGMAQHMMRLAREPEFAKKLGQAAQERIRAEFSMEKHISHLWVRINDCIPS
jgi:colanic acid/amylovoran biosynthesis glycosyltransferase